MKRKSLFRVFGMVLFILLSVSGCNIAPPEITSATISPSLLLGARNRFELAYEQWVPLRFNFAFTGDLTWQDNASATLRFNEEDSDNPRTALLHLRNENGQWQSQLDVVYPKGVFPHETDITDVLPSNTLDSRLSSTPAAPPSSSTSPAIPAQNVNELTEMQSWDLGAIVKVAYGPRTEILAVATYTGIDLYDTPSLRKLHHLPSDAGIRSIDFSPDENWLAVGDDQGAVTIWRTDNWILAATFQASSHPISLLRFNPTGALLATAQKEGYEVQLWRVADQSLFRELPIDRAIYDLVFLPDGSLIIGSSGDFAYQGWIIHPRLSDGNLGNVHSTVNGVVTSLAATSDGKRLAIGSEFGPVELYDIEQNHTLWQRSVCPEILSDLWPVRAMAVSPDQKLLALSCVDDSIQVLRLSDGELVHTFKAHVNPVHSLAFSADSSLLISSSKDRVAFWRLRDGKEAAALENYAGGITTVAYSPDGQWLAAGQENGEVSVWDSESGQLRYALKAHKKPVTRVAFSPDGALLVTASADGRVRMWRMQDGALLYTLRGHKNEVTDVAFHPDGSLIATSSMGKLIKLWRADDGTFVRSLSGHEAGVVSLAFSPDGRLLASASQAGTVGIWDVETGRLLHKLKAQSVSDVLFSPDGQLLLMNTSDGIELWRVADWSFQQEISSLGGVASMAISPDNLMVAIGKRDGAMIFWDIPSDERLFEMKAHHGPVTDIAFRDDGVRLVSASADGTMSIWGITSSSTTAIPSATPRLTPTPAPVVSKTPSPPSTPTSEKASEAPIKIVLSQKADIEQILFSQDGNVLAVHTSAGVELFDAKTHESLQFIPGEFQTVTLSPGGTLLFTSSERDAIQLWRISDGELLYTLDDISSPVARIVVSPDSALFAVISQNNTFALRRVLDGKPYDAIHIPRSNVSAVAFSPDSVFLAVGMENGTITIWQLSQGARYLFLKAHDDAVLQLTFSPEGESLISVSENAVKWWRIRDGNLISVFYSQNDPLQLSPITFTLGGPIQVEAEELWRIGDGAKLFQLSPRLPNPRTGAMLLTMAFSPRGTYLAAGIWQGDSYFGYIDVWYTANGQEMGMFEADRVLFAFSPDESIIAVPGQGEVLLWRLPAEHCGNP